MYRTRDRAAARLRHGARFWAPIPNMAGPLCTLVRQILKFHESQPLLMNPKFENRSENGQFYTDSPREFEKRAENGPISDSGSPLATMNSQPNSENRSENGQFYTDSPPEFENRAENGPISDSFQPVSGSQRSTLNTRLTEQQRAEQFRRREWALYEAMLRAGSAMAEDIRRHPRRVSLLQLAKVYEIAFALGRRAAGMPLDGIEPPKPEPPFAHLDIEAALRRAYGHPPQASQPLANPGTSPPE